MMIRVVIVEDIKEIREGLQMLIDGSDGFVCAQTFATGEEALEKLPGLCPDVALMDINLPGINGIEAIRRLKTQCSGTQFIMSTVYEDDESIFESLKAGASGYLLKKTAPAKILESIIEVYHGGSPMSGQIARKVISSFQQKDSIDGSELLTQREKEILKSLAKGLRYKEIASEFNIGIETVRSHARNIYEKLQVQSRMDAINKIMGR
jgi:DNA-binding NarL/FixJ family response regulator